MPLDADEAGVLEEDLKEAAATEAGASTKKTTPGQPRAKIREFEFRTLVSKGQSSIFDAALDEEDFTEPPKKIQKSARLVD